MESIKKIAVLYGGSSSEREVSIESGKRVHDAIIELGYECKKFDINGGVIEMQNNKIIVLAD